MNIKTFLNWRPNCFFCGKELFVAPGFPKYHGFDGEKTACTLDIEKESVSWSSEDVNFSVDIISGFICADNSVKTTGFVSQLSLVVEAKCLWCRANGRDYYHVAEYSSNESYTHYMFEDLWETLRTDNMELTQSKESRAAVIRTLKNKGLRLEDYVVIPYIDLNKTAPLKLANKIRTCITFS